MLVSPHDLVEDLRRQYFSDTRVTYADLRVAQRPDTVSVSGTILDRASAELLLGTLYQRAPTLNWRDDMTPLVTGPDYSWALVERGVIDIRHEPSNAAERTSQVLFGEPVEILRRSDDWAFVRSRDGYLGWTHARPLRPVSAEAAHDWSSTITHIVRQPLLACYADASGEPHQQSMLIPFGSRLHIEGADGVFRKVRCPEGRVRWVPVTGLLPAAELWGHGVEGLKTVVNWAQALVGVPYLWGGKTPFGYDCSGLVQMLFSMIAVDLPRDANQQFTHGRVVDFAETQFGDCLFFDTQATEQDLHAGRELLDVSHVALALDHDTFLHASRRFGGVVRGSFDQRSPWFTPTFRERLLGVRRYV